MAAVAESLQLQFLSHPILKTSCFLCVVTVVDGDPVVITLEWINNLLAMKVMS